ELGVVVIDIGGGTTDVALMRNGAVWHTVVLPLGGDHITNDIAIGLRTPTADAEDIKKRYGCALTALVPAEETVDVPSVGGRKPRQLSRQLLSEIIQPRVEEIFTLVARELARAGFQDAATAGVVVTGGTSIMEGVPELAEGIFDQPVRRGVPIGIGGLADVIESPIYATGVGLALYGARTGAPGESGAGPGPVGGGGNGASRMMAARFAGGAFIVANTDLQALSASPAPVKLQLGAKLTQGRGAGSNPDVGRNAAQEDPDQITRLLSGCDMVFITAGLGGGTGTGAAPVVASLAKDLGILTVAVVTKPFTFEGRKRMLQAEAGLEALRGVVDTLITIPNQRLLSVVDRGTPLIAAFRVADSVLQQAVQGVSDLVLVPGLVNLDFADVRTIMSGMGLAMMGTGTGKGENRAL